MFYKPDSAIQQKEIMYSILHWHRHGAQKYRANKLKIKSTENETSAEMLGDKRTFILRAARIQSPTRVRQATAYDRRIEEEKITTNKRTTRTEFALQHEVKIRPEFGLEPQLINQRQTGIC